MKNTFSDTSRKESASGKIEMWHIQITSFALFNVPTDNEYRATFKTQREKMKHIISMYIFYNKPKNIFIQRFTGIYIIKHKCMSKVYLQIPKYFKSFHLI